nr:diguanylate cyclase [bacterium]
YIWCRVRVTDQYNEVGTPIKAVGVITDIEHEKRMIDDLKRKAERDALTGLYNREETERQISRYLESKPEGCNAILMIDTDNFKRVNDSQGHLFGDAVLSKLAASMKRLTRKSDVVGRIGGDEFMIFLKNMPNRKGVERKAAQLLDMFRNLFQDGNRCVQITGSIGVAVYPWDGDDFASLYHGADVALYQAKKQGKNQYVMYDPKQFFAVPQRGYSSLGATIDSDQQYSGIPSDLTSYVFQILYGAQDMDEAIELILEIVGKRFDVSRAYIFENTEDGLYADNTYEWCNEGIRPEKANLQKVPYEGLDGYQNLFQNDSIFYCRDIHELTPAQAAFFEKQGIRSTVQCAINKDNRFCGFVGFDECTGMRLWTKEEIGMLSLVAQMLTTFLQKKRAMERDARLVGQLRNILDMQDAYVYVVNPETYELLFLNAKTRGLDSQVQLGMKCFSTFFGRETPCKHCPLCTAQQNGEFYNPQYDVWTKVHTVPIQWKNSQAALFSCYDITAYKKMQSADQ